MKDGKLAGALDEGKMAIYSVSRAFEIVHQLVRHACPRTVRGRTVEGKPSLQASGHPEPSSTQPVFPLKPTANRIASSALKAICCGRRSSLAPWREWPEY